MIDRAHSAAGKTKPLTVSDAIESYVDYLETNRKSGREDRYAANAFKRTSPRCRLAFENMIATRH
jgi:hypothetical protein